LRRFQGVEKYAIQSEKSASVVSTTTPTATTATTFFETTEKRRRGKRLLELFENDAINELKNNNEIFH